MAGDFSGLLDAHGAPTPYRRSKITLDVPDSALLEDAYYSARFRGEIAPHIGMKGSNIADAVSTGAKGAFIWPCGCWTTVPLPFTIEELSQAATADSTPSGPGVGVLGVGATGPEATTVPSPTTSPNTATGVLVTPTVATTPIPEIATSTPANQPTLADWFHRRLLDLSAGFTPSTYPLKVPGVLTPPKVSIPSSPISSPPTMLAQVPTSDLDPVQKTLNLPPDTGVVIRFRLFGTTGGRRGMFAAAHFGQYALAFFGSGTATLFEFCLDAEGAAQTRERFSFPYCTGDPVGQEHLLMVWPTMGPVGEKYINFIGKGLTRVTSIPGTIGGADTSSPTERVYMPSPLTRGTDQDAAPDHVTKGGPAVFSVDRQVDLDWQFSRLMFAKGGILEDEPHASAEASTSRAWTMQAVIGMNTVFSTNTIPTGVPYIQAWLKNLNADTTDTGATSNGVFGTQALTARHVKPKFILTGYDSPAGYSAYCRQPPILWGYTLARQGVIADIDPGSFDLDFLEARLTGDLGDPRQVGGMVRVMTTSASPARASRLQQRAAFTAEVTTQWVPPGGDTGSPMTLRLFRGKVDRSTFDRMAPHDAGQFPGDTWGEHSLPLVGRWERIARHTSRTIWTLKRYAIDPYAPPTYLPGQPTPIPTPWKVTDVLRDILQIAGEPPDMIDIPDLPIRLFMGLGADTSHLVVDACTSLAERAVRLARNYLGMVLVFDAAAGTRGQWKLIAPPPEGTAPIYHFVLEPPAGRDVIAPHLPSHYPANTTFARDVQQLRKVAPEGNHLWIFTAPDQQRTGGFKYERHFYNDEAYQVPGFSTTPDPDSPHYTDGCESIIACPMPELFQGDDRPALTYHALMAVGWRIFNYSCRARHIRTIRAPLWPIQDPTGGYWRPLRYGDPVSYNGQAGWFVNTPGIEIQADPNQEQTLEIMRLCPLRSLPAGV